MMYSLDCWTKNNQPINGERLPAFPFGRIEKDPASTSDLSLSKQRLVSVVFLANTGRQPSI